MTDVAPKRNRTTEKISMFGAKKRAAELAIEADYLEAQLTELGGMDVIQLRQMKARLELEVEAQRQRLAQQLAEATQRQTDELLSLERQKADVSSELKVVREAYVETKELVLLQEAGVYDYRHPLDDALQYKAEIDKVKASIKRMVLKDGGAITSSTTWTVEGSAAKGRKMVKDFSKLMLRAYNNEADTLVRNMKPYKLEAAVEKLRKSALTIEKLGKTMGIEVNDTYERLRTKELELTADYIAKVAVEKEREREEKQRLRDEKKAQLDFERAKAKLEKERQHFVNALAKLEEQGDFEGAARLREQLADVEKAIVDVDYRAANIRAGYVYVISNYGAFGERMVKIGMTRRLEPLDRVRELGDASVPFRFDVHAIFFSEDAISIENQLHQHFAEHRVNKINQRREFFYATPAQVREALLTLKAEVLHFEEDAAADEFRQSHGDAVVLTTAPQVLDAALSEDEDPDLVMA